MLTRGRRVQFYGNVVVEQSLSASSVISATCVSVGIEYICNKIVNSLINSKCYHCS